MAIWLLPLLTESESGLLEMPSTPLPLQLHRDCPRHSSRKTQNCQLSKLQEPEPRCSSPAHLENNELSSNESLNMDSLSPFI